MTTVTPWLTFLSAQDVDTGGAPWTSPGGVLILGGLEASSGPFGPASFAPYANTLRVSQPAIAGQLPAQFRLLGAEIELWGRWQGATGGTRSVPVQSVVGSTVRAELGSCTLPLKSTPVVCFKGGPNDTLGFTEADVTLPGLGFQLGGTTTVFSVQGNTLYLDSLRVRFYWTDPLPPRLLRSRTRERFTRRTTP